MRTLLTFLAICGTTGCGATRQWTRGITDEHAFATAIAARIPLGMPIDEAKVALKRDGFRCADVVDGRLKLGGDERPKDYVECSRTRPSGLLQERTWKVYVVHRNGRVVSVHAMIHLTGV